MRYASIPFLGKGGSGWPLMWLDLEPETFVLRLLRPLGWIAPTRLRYEEVAEAQLRVGSGTPSIRLRLTDPSRGVIRVIAPNDGVFRLAERLEERGVRVYGLEDSA